MKKWIIGLSYVLLVTLCISMAILLLQGGDNKVSMKPPNGFPGGIAEYTYYDRTLSINDFIDIAEGSLYVELVQRIGKENGTVGSGIVRPYFQLIDGSCIVIEASSTKNGYETISNIIVVDTAGRWYRYRNIWDENTTYPYFSDQVIGFKTFDRSLQFSDFSAVEIGMSYKEIVDIIGEPNGLVGTDTPLPYYRLTDGSFVTLYCRKDFEEYTELFNLSVSDMKGREFKLVLE